MKSATWQAGRHTGVSRSATQWIVALLCGLAPCQESMATQLEIMVENDAAPWSKEDGNGYANDVVKSAFHAAGVDVVLLVVPYARCKQMVTTGKVAGCFSMSWDRAFVDKVAFSTKPLFSVRAQYFQNAGKPLAARNEAELKRGTKVGTVLGYEYPESTNRLRDQGIVFEETRSEESNLKKLAAGHIDAAIINEDAIKTSDFVVERAGVVGKVSPIFHTKAFGSYIGFSRIHRQGKWAQARFDAGYALIEKTGELQRIQDHWGLRGRLSPK